MLKRTHDFIENIENEEEQTVNSDTKTIRKLDEESRIKRELEKQSFRNSATIIDPMFNLDEESAAVVDHSFKRSKRIVARRRNNDIEQIIKAISSANLDAGSAQSHYTQLKP